jgi:hypothetical protein
MVKAARISLVAQMQSTASAAGLDQTSPFQFEAAKKVAPRLRVRNLNATNGCKEHDRPNSALSEHYVYNILDALEFRRHFLKQVCWTLTTEG